MSTSKEEGTEQAKMGNWSLLPSDLVQTIAERLLADVTDYIRFRAVCFSWRASTEDPRRILLPPQLPMLMLSFNEVATNARSFFRLDDQRTITFEIDREIANNRFVGSVDGWLALVNESSAMHLFDPLTGDLVRLPSMSTLLNIIRYDEHEVGNEYIVERDQEKEAVDSDYLRDIFVTKVALSSVHHEGNPIAMLLLQFFDKLVFAKVGDAIWTEIDTSFQYCDILYYQGQFFAVGSNGELMVCDIVGPSPKATLKTTAIDTIEMGIPFCHWYLAECAGDLLVVARSYKERTLHRHVYELEKFLVFKVESLSDEPKFVLLESLGEHVLFLGSNQSISLSASDFPGRIRGNSIYFTGTCFDVCFDSAQAPKPGNTCSIREFFHKGDDFGVFNLADGKVKSLPCYPGNSHQFIWPPPVWFGLNIRQESDCMRKFFLPKGTKACMKNSPQKSGLNKIKAFLKEQLNRKPAGGSSHETKTSASIELTSRNFDELILKSKELWIVEFFAPWCEHCKNLAPEWKRASNNLKGKVKLGHVDCDAEKSLMSRYSGQVFPTILVFGADKDSPFQYEGAQTASAIESFALEQLETNVAPPEVSELTGPDVMEEKCASSAICFVAFLPDILDSKAEGRNKYIELLLSVAEKFKRSPYSYVWAAAGKQVNLENQVGVGGYGYPALIALNAKKGVYAPLRSAFELDQVIEFVKEAGRGGKGNLPLGNAPTVVLTEPWDGKDGEIIEDDEFWLEDLMGDEAATDNDEL